MVLELKDTVGMMGSTDYKERFKAEYLQIAVRYRKLDKMVRDWDNGKLQFTPTCPRSIYELQLRAMTDYLEVLEARAKIEGVELEEYHEG